MSRAEEAAHRAALAEGQKRMESQRAQVLIDKFLQQVRERGISPAPLRATLLSGASVKTDQRGWYLRRDESVAIGEDGHYYVLVVPGGLVERLRGVKLTASTAPLIVGQGGRDGETGPLTDFLARRLDQG